MIRTLLFAGLLASAAPVFAETHQVAPGPDAQQKLQEALILAKPGDVVELAAGRYVLDDGLSLDVEGVTVRGAGIDKSVLDFTHQKSAGEGLLVTSDNVTLRDFAVENPQGDGIKSKDADNIVYYRIRVEWTGGPKETNGAYGLYPVESDGVLIDECTVSGASDAGIYVGQSNHITVRHSVATGNVAGIEIENSRNALVSENAVSRNTGGILVFDLPSLPVMGGGNVIVERNAVTSNDTPNFAPKGNIVASVRRGTGVLIMANDKVLVENNAIVGNATAGVMVVSYINAFDDKRYNPYPRHVTIGANAFQNNGTEPQLDRAPMLLKAFGGKLPPVMWDGLGDKASALYVASGIAGWSLNLPEQGKGLADAKPAPLDAPAPPASFERTGIGAPLALEKRIG
ncbi:MAG: parallel beta-helix domain-containing protein [Sphingomonadaceae bacterium]